MVKTISDLEKEIERIQWFSALGVDEEFDGIETLKYINGPWPPNSSDVEIAERMIFLPQFPGDEDPFYEKSLTEISKEQGVYEELKTLRLRIGKAVLKSQKGMEIAALKDDWSDSTLSAQRSAAHAFRSAATEIALSIPGKWCEVVYYYIQGRWPCGYIPEEDLIVIY